MSKYPCEADAAIMKNITTNNQMELGFNGAKLAGIPSSNPRNRRIRAAWWFNQMRSLVDSAMDWKPAAEPRPEQTFLPGTTREVQL